MQKTLLFKLIAILALTIVICIPMGLIQDTIEERSVVRQEAVQSVSAESVREQTITGPVLVLPYIDEYVDVIAAKSSDKKAETIKRRIDRRLLVFPNQLNVDGKIDSYRRYRGIHQVLMYNGTHQIKGDFVLPPESSLERGMANSKITLGRPFLALGIEDVRGIRDIPKVNWNGAVIEFQQGTGLASQRGGVHADLPPLPMGGAASFAFKLALDGIERQHFVPIGKNNSIKLQSNWPHPQFGGDFLPAPDRRVDASGFSANWTISALSTDAQQQLRDNENSPHAKPQIALDRFSVSFIEPVNVYSMAERATKYGLLFVVLTFAAFFMFEVLKALPIHPVQYLLVGLALVLFFLLLVSLSEHIAFGVAYVVASAACIVLIGFYLTAVLRDWRRAMGFATGLTLLYGALFGLLISENNALVLGSLLLFAVLAAVMLATRKVDWYQIGKTEPVAG